MTAEQAPFRDLHDLYMYLSSWRSTNQYDRRIEYRWLAEVANELEKLARDLKSCGVDALDEPYQQRLRDFRIREIDAEKLKLEQQQALLDGELRKLRDAPPTVRAA